MDVTVTAGVRLACGGGGGGGRPLLGDRVTPPVDDDDEGLEMDDEELIGVLSQVQHAYRRLLQSNNCFYTGHGTTADWLLT